jgi:SOS regulatory protein LexA
MVAKHSVWVLNQITPGNTFTAKPMIAVKNFEGEIQVSRVSRIDRNGKPIMNIADECNGLELFVLYFGFLLAMPAVIKRKIWFGLCGILKGSGVADCFVRMPIDGDIAFVGSLSPFELVAKPKLSFEFSEVRSTPFAQADADSELHADRPRLKTLPGAGFLLLPLIGRVAAGHPILATENIEKEINVDLDMFAERPDYLLKVKGLSMRDAGILDGDLLAIKKVSDARNGQIVVARIDEEVTVKRLSKSGGRIELLPENPDFEPIQIQPGQDFSLEGIAVGLIRNTTLH